MMIELLGTLEIIYCCFSVLNDVALKVILIFFSLLGKTQFSFTKDPQEILSEALANSKATESPSGFSSPFLPKFSSTC